MDDIETFPNVKKYIYNLESKVYADYLHYLKIFYTSRNEANSRAYIENGDYILISKNNSFKITPPRYLFIEDADKKYREELHIIKSQVRLIRDKLLVYPEDQELIDLLQMYVAQYRDKIQSINELYVYTKHIYKTDIDTHSNIHELSHTCKELYNKIVTLSSSLDSSLIIDYLNNIQELKNLKDIKTFKNDKTHYFIIVELPIIDLNYKDTSAISIEKEKVVKKKTTIRKKEQKQKIIKK